MTAGAGGVPEPVRSVLLVGFMASGKTTVGRRTADALGWTFLDVDERVEARAGTTIEALFRDRGEAAFRALEDETTRGALASRSAVIATGGGWPAVPGRMESLPDDVLSVWLRVGPETAVERARRDPTVRPLLEVDDPVGRAEELLRRRRPFYELARIHIDGDRTSPDAAARVIVEAVASASPLHDRHRSAEPSQDDR
jgi:shikimate kinase